MKKNKMIMFIIVTIIVILIAVLGYFVYRNIKKEEKIQEYTPGEEISDSQLRMTNIELYFLNKENNEIEMEIRNIDAKNLIDKPIDFVVNELIKGPENEGFEGIIPNNTILSNSEILDGILYLNFNDNLIIDESKLPKIEETLRKTLEQFIEINQIKILINGTEMENLEVN